MANAQQITPPISVNLRGEEISISIATQAELERFVSNEENTWGSLRDLRNLHPALRAAVDRQLEWTSRLKEHYQSLASGDDKRRVSGHAQIKSLLDQLTEGQVISAVSLAGKKLIELSRTNPGAAGVRLARLLKLDRDRYANDLNIQVARAVVDDSLAERDLTASITTYEKEFDRARVAFEALLKDANTQFESMKTQMATAVAQVEKDRATASERQELAVKNLASAEGQLRELTLPPTFIQ
jgi:hypothetical protein